MRENLSKFWLWKVKQFQIIILKLAVVTIVLTTFGSIVTAQSIDSNLSIQEIMNGETKISLLPIDETSSNKYNPLSVWDNKYLLSEPLKINKEIMPNGFLDDCWTGAEKNGAFCYVKCREGYHGVGPVCWGKCPVGYTDDGATCRRDVKIISANNSSCPWYDKCGLTLKKGCSICPSGYKNDGCTCRRDVHITSKPSYGRGAGYFIRSDYQGIFYRYIRDHRNIWIPSASPLTETEKTYLRQFFPNRLVESVRVKELDGMTGAFNFSASATTYGNDFIIIRKGKRTNELLKHEFVHVCQYDKLGVQGFANTYADQYVDGGYEYSNIEFEKQAWGFAWKKSKIADYLGYCE
jgi:hypothetical protein